MKRLYLSLLAVAWLSSPITLGLPSPAQAQRTDHNGRADQTVQDDRRQSRNGRSSSRVGPRDSGFGNQPDRHRQDAWAAEHHNGYYFNNRWAYGRPPAAYLRSPGYRPGYSAWRAGAYLPSNYTAEVIEDYEQAALRRPPRGYHWVRVDNSFLLVAIASGLIFDVIATRR